VILHALDWLVIGFYAVALLAITFRVARKQESSEGYFLAGRSLRWPLIGASLFAANISAEHFVGLAGSGYSGGMAVGGFEQMAGAIQLVFCWRHGQSRAMVCGGEIRVEVAILLLGCRDRLDDAVDEGLELRVGLDPQAVMGILPELSHFRRAVRILTF